MIAWTRTHLILLALNAALLAGFGVVFLARANYEFVIYVGVIVACLGLVVATRHRVAYSVATPSIACSSARPSAPGW